jgi:phosphate transport system substrate-binding protein
LVNRDPNARADIGGPLPLRLIFNISTRCDSQKLDNFSEGPSIPRSSPKLRRTANFRIIEGTHVDTQNVEPASTGSPAGEHAKSQTSRLRLLLILVLGAAAAAVIYFAPRFFSNEAPAPTNPKLEIGGTSTMLVVADSMWKRKYREDKGVDLMYDSTGTTGGIIRMLDGNLSIAFTHGALSPEQRQKAKDKGDVVHIPILFFGVAPIYNVKELKDKPPLNLTGEILSNIFLGKVTKWNDPAIALANPGVVLPSTEITVVHRQDSSGTTHVFTEYLDKATAATGDWQKKDRKPGATVKWPIGPKFAPAERNLGVLVKVHQTEGAIGYVDRMFTSYDETVVEYAAVQNKDKTAYVRAEPNTLLAAAAEVIKSPPDDLVFDLTNRSGPEAYPISGVIYAVCYQKQSPETKQRTIDFLHWATHDGQQSPQQSPTRIACAPLPPELVKRVEQKLESMKAAP